MERPLIRFSQTLALMRVPATTDVCRKDGVPGGDAESVIHNHDAAITESAQRQHHAVRVACTGAPSRRPTVNPVVERAFTREGSRRSPKLSVMWPRTGQTGRCVIGVAT